MNAHCLPLLFAALAVALPAAAREPRAAQHTAASEAAEHPRIAAAIRELEEAIQYMEKAPHDFGGHKAEALRAAREAVQQLRKALAYRAKADNRR